MRYLVQAILIDGDIETVVGSMHDGDDPTAYWYTPGYFSSVWQLRRIFRSMDRLFKEAG